MLDTAVISMMLTCTAVSIIFKLTDIFSLQMIQIYTGSEIWILEPIILCYMLSVMDTLLLCMVYQISRWLIKLCVII
jgi:hypothetical protein